MLSRTFSRIAVLIAISMFACVLFLLPSRHAQNSADSWTPAQTIQAVDFVKELSSSKTPPTILFVGFPRLYTAGHIKGAQFHGSGGSAEGLNEMKTWAATLPKSSNLVIYCGCCPMEHCPNIRPAFAALRDLGFTKLHVLVLPTSFEVDWAEKGYAYEKGK
jgi:thiosulfate/3-mercaptopyruvate sulfurtransferase